MSEIVGQDIREDQFDGISRYSWQLYTGPRYDVPPKLLKCESYVETCASCHSWVERYPQWLGEMDKSWQCEKCGCSSVDIRVGRPYGPKSREWDWIEKLFYELWPTMEPNDYIGLHTYPQVTNFDLCFEDAFDTAAESTSCPECGAEPDSEGSFICVSTTVDEEDCYEHSCYWIEIETGDDQ